jgi:hypothetical protein
MIQMIWTAPASFQALKTPSRGSRKAADAQWCRQRAEGDVGAGFIATISPLHTICSVSSTICHNISDACRAKDLSPTGKK